MQPETIPAEPVRDNGHEPTKPAVVLPGGNLLTTSRIKAEHRCSREQHIRYELGYLPLKDDEGPARLGTLVHLGLEAWWKWFQRPDEGTPLAAAILALPEGADPFESAKARAMLIGYDARWRDDAERYEVLGVEVELEPQPIINPASGRTSRTWVLGGKLDVYVRELATDRRLVIEHKTTSEDVSEGSDYFKRLRLDSQVSVYTTMTDAEAVLYDVLAKPGQRPGSVALTDEDGVKIVLDANGERVRTKDGKKWRQTGDAAEGYVLQAREETPEEFFVRVVDAIAENPDRYFARAEVVRLETEILDHQADVWGTAQRIRENQIVGRWPRNPESCVRFGRTCAYFAVCCGEASLEDGSLFEKTTSGHVELAVKH